MKIVSTFFTIILICVITACSQVNYKKTSSGVAYNIISGGKNDTIKIGQFVKFNLKVMKGDSVLASSYNKLPNYINIDSSILKGNQHSFLEVFPFMHNGDSAVCVLLVDSLRKKSFNPLPPFFKNGEKLMVYIKVLKVFNNQDDVKADYDKEMDDQKKRELATIEQYLKNKNIKTQKTASGVYVEIQQLGDGMQVDSGKQVTVMYRGQLFNGKIFDSNMDTLFKHTQPFTFSVGKGQVIKGWDEGLKLFKKGGKGRLFIPSSLGYGPNQAGPDIQPFSNLIFDIEIKDVK